jgi:hypothetical protein
MKKLMVIAVLALSFLATARTSNKADNPFPGCNPCPFVR